jgi:hypothetical protein
MVAASYIWSIVPTISARAVSSRVCVTIPLLFFGLWFGAARQQPLPPGEYLRGVVQREFVGLVVAFDQRAVHHDDRVIMVGIFDNHLNIHLTHRIMDA